MVTKSAKSNQERLIYLPLFVIALFSLIFSYCLSSNYYEGMYRFMGFFLSLFALFKWIDIRGFIEGFKEYDLIHKILPIYPLIYAILEAYLGFNFIGLNYLLPSTYLTLVVMALNGISVIKALKSKRKIECACLGTAFKLPLTVVSFFEIAVMLVMAILMLFI
jgi:hypothetical protein